MAAPTDSLKTLPLELRQRIYSYLLFNDQAGTVCIKHRPSSAEYVPAILALPENSRYIAHRREPHEKWLDDVEDAFLQGMYNICEDISRTDRK